MSSSLRRGALAAAAIAFSLASLAACGAGNDAQTLQIHPDHAAATVGTIQVQNAVVVTQPGVQTKGPAVIIATLFNSGTTDETLDAIRVDGDGSAQLTAAQGGGKVTVPAHGSVILGGKDNASAALTNPGPVLKDGNAQKITFTFSKTGDVSLRAFVVPAEGYFDKWGPSNIPAAPGAPAASHSPAGKRSKSPSDAPSESASAPEGADAAATPSDSASQSAAGH
ncbi:MULTISPECIES: DUF461 domain-containing protein [unclassified Streptomyces]|uniref:DUF461 domain-containing protein n=1 Tax=unclassified Streptomyces TaxID=2593676 RepID=UPI00340F3537